MVTAEQTIRKYHGRKAATYDAVRTKQERWDAEQKALERMLRPEHRTIMDVPCGTGRFFRTYVERGARHVTAVDASDAMLSLARRKFTRIPNRHTRFTLVIGDARSLPATDASHDAVVCFRFLDLIDEEAMRAVMRELCRVARASVILTIRLGDTYVNKSNTATHDRRKFHALVRHLGWRVENTEAFRNEGWTIIGLGLDDGRKT